MMGGRKFFVTITACLLLALFSLPANGATFKGTVSGNAHADYYLWGYDGGLTPDDVTKNIDSFFIDFYKGGTLVGDLSFSYADRQEGTDYPWIYANASAEPTGVVYYSEPFNSTTIPATIAISAVGENDVPFVVSDDSGQIITGNLDFTPIPIPGAIWLLGSGLACFTGLRKRFRKA